MFSKACGEPAEREEELGRGDASELQEGLPAGLKRLFARAEKLAAGPDGA